MKYRRFEEVPVWQTAIDLADKTFRMVEHTSFNWQGDLRRQLGKAALSVSNNIAEGFERYSVKELVNFLYIARGSAGEVRSMLHVLARNERYSSLKVEREEIFRLVESVSRQLKAWIDSLKPKPRVTPVVSAIIFYFLSGIFYLLFALSTHPPLQ